MDAISAALIWGAEPEQWPVAWREHLRGCEKCSEFQGVPCPVGSQMIREESERRHVLRRRSHGGER